MTPRYKERLSMRCPVVFAGNGYLSEGYVLNLTAPGCLIASACPAHPGDYVQLKMVLPGLKVPFYVEVAAVRSLASRAVKRGAPGKTVDVEAGVRHPFQDTSVLITDKK